MPPDADLLKFFLSFIRQHATARGMMQAAAAHYGVDRRTIYNWLAELRQRRAIGRDVFRSWRDG